MVSTDGETDNKQTPHTGHITWNRAIENVARDIGNKAMGYKWMHIHSAEKLELYYNRLSYVNIAIAPIIAIGVIAPPEMSSQFYLKVILSVLALTNGIASSLLKFWNNIEKSQEHRYTAIRYSSLVSNIRRQLSLPYNNRQDGKVYIEWIAREYDQLVGISPPLDRKCIAAYARVAKITNIPVPDHQGVVAIKIITSDDKIPFRVDEGKDTAPAQSKKQASTYFKNVEQYTDAVFDYELDRLNS